MELLRSNFLTEDLKECLSSLTLPSSLHYSREYFLSLSDDQKRAFLCGYLGSEKQRIEELRTEAETLQIERLRIEERIEKLRIERRKKTISQLFDNKLPPLARALMSSMSESRGTTPKVSSDHQVDSGSLVIQDDDQDPPIFTPHPDVLEWDSRIYCRAHRRTYGHCVDEVLTYSVETDLQSFVEDLVKDILIITELEEKVICVKEIYLSLDLTFSPNISLILFGTQPIGVIKVTKPSNDVLLDQVGILQLVRYLQDLSSLYGVNNPIGIFTCFSGWRKIQLISDVTAYPMSVRLETDPIDDISASLSAVDINQTRAPPITVRASKIYSFDDNMTIHFLCHTVKTMSESTLVTLSSLYDKRRYSIWNEDGVEWKPMENFLNESFKETEKFTFFTTNLRTNQTFLTLRHYGTGRDGRVLLATTSDGSLLVLKFPKLVKNLETLVNNEIQRWKLLWETKVPLIFNRHNLLYFALPFVFRVVFDDLEDGVEFLYSRVKFFPPQSHVKPLEVEEGMDVFVLDGMSPRFDAMNLKKYLEDPLTAAREALERMEECNLIHNDLQWRHLALLPIPPDTEAGQTLWKVKPIFLDLADMTERTSTSKGIEVQLSQLNAQLRTFG